MNDKLDYFFVGWNSELLFNILMENNCNMLLSQYNNRPMIKRVVEYKKEHPEYTGKLFIDSGAYTVSTKGDEVDIDSYISYINEIGEYVDIIAPLDVIPKFKGDKTEEASEKNYNYMMEHLKYPEKLIPVFHEGESWEYLKKILSYGKDYIAVGALVGASKNQIEYFLNKVFLIIKEFEKETGRKIKVHTFGMTNQKLLKSFPITSADSTSHIMCASRGSIMTDYGIIPVSDVQSNLKNHIFNKSDAAMKTLQKYLDKLGITLDQITGERGYIYRTVINVYYILDFCNHYKYEDKITRKPLF